MAEIHENCPGVKMVLTALKCDLRKDEEQNENPNAVSFEEGLAKAKEVGAVKYLGLYFFSFQLVSRTNRKKRMLCSAKSRDTRDILRGRKSGSRSEASRRQYE